MDALIRYQKLFVVSDLHLGGEPGFQTFAQGKELAALVDHVAAPSASGSIALVLNGDIVDFLAERDARYLDPAGAVAKLERIFADPAFSMVWAALRRLVGQEGCELVLVLGNHDVELTLPDVRERLLRELCGGSAAARGRVRFAFDGAGFSCMVGNRRVLCTHGNEVDSFNVVDFRQLLEVQRAGNRGQPYPRWTPNAGTMLVVDVMNDAKARFPFVDLLKPETKPVPAILFALDKNTAKRIAGMASVLARLATDTVRMETGLLGAEQAMPEASASNGAALQHLVLDAFGRADIDSPVVSEVLARVEENYQDGVRPDRAWAGEGQELLGTWGLVVDRLMSRNPMENLRDALTGWLGRDETFEVDTEDETFVELDKIVSSSVDFIVAGHTHLQRALTRRNGRGVYFNSGTWIRLIKLTRAMLADKAAFEPVYNTLKSSKMSDLDAARPGGQPLVLQRPTVVEISATATGATGRLATVRIGATTVLETVPRSEKGI